MAVKVPQKKGDNINHESSVGSFGKRPTSSRSAARSLQQLGKIDEDPAAAEEVPIGTLKQKTKDRMLNVERCLSCNFTGPEAINKQTKNGVKLFRSRERINVLGPHHPEFDDDPRDQCRHSSSPESLGSSCSIDSLSHPHEIQYLTQTGPSDAEEFTRLRSSAIRTLSCENLPPGISSGKFTFGDHQAGYTIAYRFRVQDYKARGQGRLYALVALVKDSRAYRATPFIWHEFRLIANWIQMQAERTFEEEKRQEEAEYEAIRLGRKKTTGTSSFLTDRGGGKAFGGIGVSIGPGPRNLTSITSNDYLFPELHARFTCLLQELGNRFGCLPLSDEVDEDDGACEPEDEEENADVKTVTGEKGRVDHTPETAMPSTQLMSPDPTPSPSPGNPASPIPTTAATFPQGKVVA